MSSLQAEIERRGTRIFELVDRYPESIFSKAGFYQRIMEFSMRDEHFKVQMFRFVDVLASLRRGPDIVQHLDEYFAEMRDGVAPLVQTGVHLARVVPWVSGKILRWNVSGMARQFIAGRNPAEVMKTLRKRRKQGIGFTFRRADGMCTIALFPGRFSRFRGFVPGSANCLRRPVPGPGCSSNTPRAR